MSKEKFIISLTFIIFLYSCGSGLSYEEEIAEYYHNINMAKSCISNNNNKGAIKYCDIAIEITDTLSEAFCTKGIAYLNMASYSNSEDDSDDNYDEAEDCFDEAIDIDGEKAIAYKYRAKLYLKINDDDSFRNDLKIYAKHHPYDTEIQEIQNKYYKENPEKKIIPLIFRYILLLYIIYIIATKVIVKRIARKKIKPYPIGGEFKIVDNIQWPLFWFILCFFILLSLYL